MQRVFEFSTFVCLAAYYAATGRGIAATEYLLCAGMAFKQLMRGQ